MGHVSHMAPEACAKLLSYTCTQFIGKGMCKEVGKHVPEQLLNVIGVG